MATVESAPRLVADDRDAVTWSHVDASSVNVMRLKISTVRRVCICILVSLHCLTTLVMQRRYNEAAVRAQRWLVENNKRDLVAHATNHYLEPGSIWKALMRDGRRAAYNLSNEGGALVEGSIYGSEVILACEAASQCNAEIVLADRSKPVSNKRLAQALWEERQKRLQGQLDDDISLLMRAAALSMQHLKDHLLSTLRTLSVSSSEFYGERLHPIFLVVAKPHYKLALKGAGCSDPDAVVAALERLMSHGSTAGGDVAVEDLRLVQDSIARIEHQKQSLRQRVFALAPPMWDSTEMEHGMCATTSGGLEVERRRPEIAAESCDITASSTMPTHSSAEQATHFRGDDTPSASCSAEVPVTWGAVRRVLLSCFSDSSTAPPSDLTDPFFQWCWRGVNKMHSFRLHEHVADFDVAHAYAGPQDMSPYYRTVIHERDAILATRLWREAAEPGKKTIVAVVGANHLPGIVQNWAQAGSDAMQSSCSEFLSVPSTSPEGAQEGGALDWQDRVVQGTALAMQGLVVAGLAYAPTRLMFGMGDVSGSRWPLRLAALPATVMCGVSAGAWLSDAWRMSRVAQLVDNIAAVPNDVNA